MIDLDAFADDVLNTDAFAVEATYNPSGGQGKTIKVAFENPYFAAQGVGEAGVSSSSPGATCKAPDVVDAARGDTLEINDVTWYVVDVQPDGDVFTVLILSRDP